MSALKYLPDFRYYIEKEVTEIELAMLAATLASKTDVEFDPEELVERALGLLFNSWVRLGRTKDLE